MLLKLSYLYKRYWPSSFVHALKAMFLFLFVLMPNVSECAQSGVDVRDEKPIAAYRGISLTLRTHPTASDVGKLAGWGVNTVRVVIHGDPQAANNDGLYLADGHTINDKAFLKLDQLVTLLSDRDIRVIICLLNFPGASSGGIWTDYTYWDQLVALWSTVATRYRKYPLVIGYDLMNEPSLVMKEGTALDRMLMQKGKWTFPEKWLNTPRDYFTLMERLGKTINDISPDKMIIVEGVGLWGHPNNFLWMRPIKARNVVYSFHMYVPHNFTDSGRRGRPIREYDSRKSRTRVLDAMAPVEAFAKKYHARIYVGELGLPYHVEGRGAGDWLRDVLDYLEQQGWSWTYWTYSIPFRSPEVVMLPNGSLDRREDTERLNVLKEYWKGHEAPSAHARP